MSAMRKRVEALEGRSPAVKRWHSLIQEIGQTEADAVAAYEAENGPIAPNDGRILHVIIEPDQTR